MGKIEREALRASEKEMVGVKKELGKVSVPRPPGEPLEVTLFALRHP